MRYPVLCVCRADIETYEILRIPMTGRSMLLVCSNGEAVRIPNILWGS